MNPTTIYSKTGKGVQEASGKTSQLSRGDRAILSAIDGKVTLKVLSAKFDRAADEKFFSLIRKMDQDGFIREVSPSTVQRGAANAPRPGAAKPYQQSQPSKPYQQLQPSRGDAEELDFTQSFSAPPRTEKPPAVAPTGDPMAAARHEAEMRQRTERDSKTKADAAAKAAIDSTQKLRLDAEARAKAAREATMAAAAQGTTTAEIVARDRAEAAAKAKAVADAKAKAEAQVREAKERAEREARAKVEAAEKVRRDAAESARREAAELRRKVEEERRAREDAEILARVEAERTRRETEERAQREAEEKKARQEADELRRKLDEERQAREEAERRAQEEREKRDKVRAEEDRRAQEEEERRDAERRALDDQERKAREEQDRHEQEENQRQIRLAREAEDKKRRDADARKKKEEEAKRWEQEEARRKADDSYRQRAEQEDKVRAEREAVESVERAEAEKKAAEAADALSGSLLADLDSFSARQDEEGKEKEEAELKARVEEERRAQEDKVQREREETERNARKEEERKAHEEERKAKEGEELQAREVDEKKKADEAEKKKREREETARRQAARGPDADIPISRADMGMDDVGDDTRKLSVEARKALRDRQREVARARSRGDQSSGRAAAAYKRKQPIKWGKPVAVMLLLVMVGAVVTLNFTPLSTTEYERLASDAVGAPVKIGSARLWVLAGVQMRFENVSIGESVKIAAVRAVPEIDTLLGEDKVFSRLEMDGVVLQQEALGNVLLGGMKGKRLRAARIVAKDVKLQGPLALPVVDIDATIGRDGKLNSVKLAGERVNGFITPGGADMSFELTMGDFTLPFLDKFSLVDFDAKGTADRAGMVVSEFKGRAYDGTLVGNARIQWGAQWSVQGEVEGRDMNAAVFSPQMVSVGRIDGKGRYTMSGPDAGKLYETVRLDGNFAVRKGALGSFDLARALQSTSAQSSGRTQFTELKGNLALASGTLALRDMRLSAGLLKATGTLDIEPNGGLSGRINAELRTLRSTMYIGGKLADPQLRR